MKKLLYTTLIVLGLACSGEDGMDGAMGPRGEQGPQGNQGVPGSDGTNGQDGEQGPQGEQGQSGTANVMYSEWLTLDFGPTPITEERVGVNIAANELTPEINDHGLVLVYARRDLGSGYQYFALPFFRYNPDYHYYSAKTFAYNDRINISIESIDGSAIWVPYFTDFRYVIVPGGVPTSGKFARENYIKMSYEELTNHFNIPK